MTGDIWVVGELRGGSLAPSTPGIASLAVQVAARAGSAATAVLVGDRLSAAGRTLAAFVPRVLCLELPGPDAVIDGVSAAGSIAALAEGAAVDHILVPATPWGRTVAGSLAARLGWGIITGAESITWADGPVVETVELVSECRVRSGFTARHGIVTVQPNLTSPVALTVPGEVHVVRVAVAALPQSRIRRLELSRAPSPRPGGEPPELENASVVVAGGAGVGSPATWLLVEQLADALGAAIGATRPAVDRGWAAPNAQIGQTGKTISPDVYIALGISGEILHRAGTRTARAVIAINLDDRAPFREHADLFVVADLRELVPELLAEIHRRRVDAQAGCPVPPSDASSK